MIDIHVIAGPTASGKSARALQLARETDGVVINADSLQLYDALPILTAQPAAGDKAEVPHRLYAILPPQEKTSAALWRGLAIREIDAALAEGHTPILCGGTGLYLKALLRGLSPMPDVPPDVRAAAMARQLEIGNPAFHAELAARDPVMAARLKPGDTQRLVRAREVLDATGRSLSHWQALPPEPPPAHYQFRLEIVDLPRADLYDRCDRRFDAMLAAGALGEVSAYAGPADSPVTAALGYAALRAHLSGELSLAEATARAKAATRQYAKRQVTWFRHQV